MTDVAGRPPKVSDGPSLETYVETRFNLIHSVIKSLESLVFQRIDESDKRYQQRFAAQEQALEKALDSMKEAINKAERATELRFESVNEFRATLTDQARDFVTRPAFDASMKTADQSHDSLNAKIDALTNRVNIMDGKQTGGRDLWGLLVGGIGLAVAVTVMVLKFTGAGG